MGNQGFGIDPSACQEIAKSIQEVLELGVQLSLVVGGGNIFRGAQAAALGFNRTPADHVGMLSTVINGLILQQALSAVGIASRVMSAFPTSSLVELYHWEHAIQALNEGSVVIFVGGTGNPYFTTDSAAALRASEIQAEIVLKATKVDGVFSADPLKNPTAEKLDQLTYADVLSQQLHIMDATAIVLCRENHIPICVFNFSQKGSIMRAVCGECVGTVIKESYGKSLESS